jgi:hypothetical protein
MFYGIATKKKPAIAGHGIVLGQIIDLAAAAVACDR